MDDGVIDKKEQKAIDDAHKRQLEARGRGPAQFKAYRQAKWMKNVRLPLLLTESIRLIIPISGFENTTDAQKHQVERT